MNSALAQGITAEQDRSSIMHRFAKADDMQCSIVYKCIIRAGFLGAVLYRRARCHQEIRAINRPLCALGSVL